MSQIRASENPALDRLARYSKQLLLALFVVVTTNATADGYLVGTVERVYDGDTVVLRTIEGEKETIRLLGIDAPEKGQPHWRDSWSWLKRTINKRSVTVKWTKRDNTDSQRLLGTIYVAGENFNLLMVCRGQAWYYRHYERDVPVEDRASYDACEKRARIDAQGLFIDAAPEPPWEYRKRMRRGKRAQD